MTDTQYLALLRGINVGGNNIIKMADLKACFEADGFSDIATYIQSGNVLLRANENDKTKLTAQIEKMLSARFNYSARLVLITHQQLKQAVEDAPAGFGENADLYRYDVIFLKEPLTASEAIKDIAVRPGVDAASAGEAVLYFSRLISRATQSYLSKIITLPIYQKVTIRNWNTTTKLLAMMNKRSEERNENQP